MALLMQQHGLPPATATPAGISPCCTIPAQPTPLPALADGAARGTKRRSSQGRGSGAAAAAALDKQAAKEMRQRAQLFLNEAGEKMKAGACAALHDPRKRAVLCDAGPPGTEAMPRVLQACHVPPQAMPYAHPWPLTMPVCCPAAVLSRHGVAAPRRHLLLLPCAGLCGVPGGQMSGSSQVPVWWQARLAKCCAGGNTGHSANSFCPPRLCIGSTCSVWWVPTASNAS